MESRITRCNYCHGIAESSITRRDGVVDEYRDESDDDKSRIEIIHLCGFHRQEVDKLLVRFSIERDAKKAPSQAA